MELTKKFLKKVAMRLSQIALLCGICLMVSYMYYEGWYVTRPGNHEIVLQEEAIQTAWPDGEYVVYVDKDGQIRKLGVNGVTKIDKEVFFDSPLDQPHLTLYMRMGKPWFLFSGDEEMVKQTAHLPSSWAQQWAQRLSTSGMVASM